MPKLTPAEELAGAAPSWMCQAAFSSALAGSSAGSFSIAAR